jgi:putative hemolysin
VFAPLEAASFLPTPFFFLWSAYNFQHAMAWFILGLLTYFLLLLSEQALVQVSAHDLEALRNQTDKAARRVVLLIEQLRSSLAALLLARLLVALTLGVCAINSFLSDYSFRLQVNTWASQQNIAPTSLWMGGALLLCLGIGLALWILHKIQVFTPKSTQIVFFVQRLSLFVQCWKTLFTPFILKEKKIAPPAHNTQASSATEPANSSSETRELELLKSIVQFGDVTVKQVMQPRSKVVAVDFRTTFSELLLVVCENEFSRMPVIDEDLDNVTGILYVKDLVPYLDKSDDFEWQTLIRTNLMLVPESKRGSELLQEFKQEKMHMAVVVDEYGGSAGIVTLEDILEEVTGDIQDEFDEESDVRYRKLDDFNYLFEGQVLLNDVCRIAQLSSNVFDAVRGNADTLAGLALELRGDIPPVGEEITWGNFQLTVTAADSRKIEQLKLTLPR